MAVQLPGRPITRMRAAFGNEEAQAQLPDINADAPDWLKTGVAGAGLGWVFGPVGGLIGAGITHAVNRNRKKSILAAAAADEQTASDLTGAINQALGIAGEQAVTDQDNAELAILEQKKTGLESLLRHYDPQIRALGIQGMLNLADQIGANLDEIEGAALQRETNERAREAQDFDRLMGISDDLIRDSQQYVKGREAWRRLMAVEPTEAGDLALIFNYMKVLDPDSTVREGEAASVQNAAGVPDVVLTAYNRLLKGGERLTPERRQDIRRQAGLAYAELRSAQIDRNSLALERGRDAGLSDELLDTLAVPIDANELSEIPAPINTEGQPPPRESAREIGQGAAEMGANLRDRVAGVIEGALGVEFVNGRVYSPNSVGAARAKLELQLENVTDPQQREQIEMDLRVLDAAEGKPLREIRERRQYRGQIVRPTN